MCKQNGFVIIIVLLFMQIFAFLSLAMFGSNTLSLKMSEDYYQKHTIFLTAEKILTLINSEIMFHEGDCEIPIIDTFLLVKKSLEWWNEVGCLGDQDKLKYYFVYEVLEENIFRITLLSVDLQNNTKEILQNTLVKMDNAIHPILWREL